MILNSVFITILSFNTAIQILFAYFTIVKKIRQEFGINFSVGDKIFRGDFMSVRRLDDGTYVGEISDENICRIFGDSGDLNRRELKVGAHILFIYSIDGLVSGGDISEFVVKPLMQDTVGGTMEELYDRALHRTVYNAVAVPCEDLDSLLQRLLNGFCIVVFGGQALAFEDKTPEKRSPSPPSVENTVKGPKDAFTETSRTNTSLLRRHLRSADLHFYETTVGTESRTNVSVAYIQGVTDPELLERMKERLENLRTRGLITPAAVEELVTGSRMTAFPLIQYTERTDRFARALLEGKIGLLVDGLPLGYLLPVDIGFFLTSGEDRGKDFFSASWMRILRWGALLVGLLLPAVYVAMVVFHPAMLPTGLLQSVIEAKQRVPFPTVFEVLGLLIAFELLQEASVSLPQSVGQSLSIIGGLVVGSAAVEAKIISPTALIVVAVAGICGFTVPGRGLADALRLWRTGLTILGALGGLYGVTIGSLCLLIHLAGLESFGKPYLAPFAKVSLKGILRPPIRSEKK